MTTVPVPSRSRGGSANKSEWYTQRSLPFGKLRDSDVSPTRTNIAPPKQGPNSIYGEKDRGTLVPNRLTDSESAAAHGASRHHTSVRRPRHAPRQYEDGDHVRGNLRPVERKGQTRNQETRVFGHCFHTLMSADTSTWRLDVYLDISGKN